MNTYPDCVIIPTLVWSHPTGGTSGRTRGSTVPRRRRTRHSHRQACQGNQSVETRGVIADQIGPPRSTTICGRIFVVESASLSTFLWYWGRLTDGPCRMQVFFQKSQTPKNMIVKSREKITGYIERERRL